MSVYDIFDEMTREGAVLSAQQKLLDRRIKAYQRVAVDRRRQGSRKKLLAIYLLAGQLGLTMPETKKKICLGYKRRYMKDYRAFPCTGDQKSRSR
tara:strand:- start:6504 stop:6788 length:285 start_codon:yes stop_codon:yes gene_type:complete